MAMVPDKLCNTPTLMVAWANTGCTAIRLPLTTAAAYANDFK